MLDASSALAHAAPAPAPATRRHVVVAGAGGALGAAVVEQLLGGAGFAQVAALVTQPIAPALRGFVALAADDDAAWAAFGADTALIVFERERGRHGREDAFLRPQPEQLATLARRLHDARVRALIVVVPHAAGLLPLALQHGLSTLDEAAVAATGFDRLVFMRMARGGDGSAPRVSLPHRLARWMLSQLHWMVPQREQPVRVQTVARLAAALARQLPGAAPGTRVWPAAWSSHAVQSADVAALVARWLAGEPAPERGFTPQRW